MKLWTLLIFTIYYFGTSQGNSTKTPDQRSEECGIKGTSDSEGYGRNPWHVAIYLNELKTNYRNICTGTIIHPNFVLTAAHCFYIFKPGTKEFDSSIFRITGGKIKKDFKKEEKYQQTVNVIEAIVHKDYNEVKNNFGNDIALIKVDPPFKLTDQVSPVCLDKSNPPFTIQPNELGTISVWDDKQVEGNNENLKELHLSTLTPAECVPKVEKFNITYPQFVTPDKLCLVHEDGKGPEHGSGGAGIIFEKVGKNYIAGIVSVNFIGEKRISTLTNVRYHLDWITKSMKPSH